MRVLTFFILLFFGNPLSSQVSISSDVWQAFEKSDKIDCILELNIQWEAPDFIKSWSKSQKGAFVFQNLQSFAKNEQAEIVTYLDKESIPYHSFFIFNGIKAKITYQQLIKLIDKFEFKSIGFDQPVPVQFMDRESFSQRDEIEWGILKIGADEVWEKGYRGQGVVVAGQDTGYDFDNPYIFSNYRGFDANSVDHNYNWHDAIHELNPLNQDPDMDPNNNPCGLDSEIPCDDHSHGTHTMGTMVGDDEVIKIGVAPEASWIGCRNMERGWGKPSTYTECFEWFLAPTDLQNNNPNTDLAPHVINNSWGCPPIEGCNESNWSFMETAVDNLVAAGVVVVASAGNDGTSGCGSIINPASIFDKSFTVGATNIVDTIAGFSSIGDPNFEGLEKVKPDVVAPGVGVKSITLNGLATWSGTSMAGPHVAGAVALLISANPELEGQVEVIESILEESAMQISFDPDCTPEEDVIPNIVYGHGRIDISKAVDMALLWSNTDEIEERKYILYPNPTTDQLYLVIGTSGPINMKYSIIDATGRLVKKDSIDSIVENIDVSSLNHGLYTILISSKLNVIETKKFIKM